MYFSAFPAFSMILENETVTPSDTGARVPLVLPDPPGRLVSELGILSVDGVNNVFSLSADRFPVGDYLLMAKAQIATVDTVLFSLQFQQDPLGAPVLIGSPGEFQISIALSSFVGSMIAMALVRITANTTFALLASRSAGTGGTLQNAAISVFATPQWI